MSRIVHNRKREQEIRIGRTKNIQGELMVKGINVIYIVFDIKLYYNDIFIFILKSNRHYTVQLFSFYQINIRWSSFNVTLVVKLSLLNWKNKQHNNNIYSFSFHKLNKPFNTKTINSFYTYWFILRHFDNSFLTRLFFFIFFFRNVHTN